MGGNSILNPAGMSELWLSLQAILIFRLDWEVGLSCHFGGFGRPPFFFWPSDLADNALVPAFLANSYRSHFGSRYLIRLTRLAGLLLLGSTPTWSMFLFSALCVRQRPYRNEHTGSLPNSEVNRCRARSVLGWGTAWEVLGVLLAFAMPGLNYWGGIRIGGEFDF